MAFSSGIFVKITIFVLAVCGFDVAQHIHKHKKPEHGPLICPVGFDCNRVVHSNFSTFLGVHLELIGMVYFATMSLVYFLLLFVSAALPVWVIYFILLASLGSFLFSLYLVGVQIFALKKGCSWCLTEAAISISIFIFNIFAYGFVDIIKASAR